METLAGAGRGRVQWLGLVGGPLLALLTYTLLPVEYRDVGGVLVPFSDAGRAALAVMTWMAVWWLSEAVDVPVTALLPLALFPVLGVADIREAAAPYASDLIFLFMGGFMIALAMQRWGLDRRIALLTLRLVGTEPRRMIGGFMLATALLSAFVSNTATTAMMLPIGLSVIELLRRQGGVAQPGSPVEDPATRNFALCLMLGIAYGASIGGISTLIGTPPNLFLASFVKQSIAEPFRQEISFVRWLGIGVPLAALFLPLTWLLLTRVLYPVRLEAIAGGRRLLAAEYRTLGPTRPGEWATLVVFGLTAAGWILRPYLPVPGLSDPGIAIIAALALFVIPVDPARRVFALDWDTAKRLPWGILILFGGGLSLAAAVQATGVAEFIGAQTGWISDWPPLALVIAVVTVVVFLTELTSNTATTATLVPILAALAPGLGLHPFELIVPATVAASCAFMMPVATPPNAIVFGSGHITIPQMCRAGFWLNLVGIVLITGLLHTVALPLLGVAG